MYVDYILSHGAMLPNLITDASLLTEFERINALEQHMMSQFSGASEPVQTVPIFTSLSNMSLRIMDEYLIRGVALPDELTNATLDAAFMNPSMTEEQVREEQIA